MNKHKAGRMALDQLKTEFEAELTKENNIYQDEGGNFISPTPTINKKLLKILKQLMLPYLKKIII